MVHDTTPDVYRYHILAEDYKTENLLGIPDQSFNVLHEKMEKLPEVARIVARLVS